MVFSSNSLVFATVTWPLKLSMITTAVSSDLLLFVFIYVIQSEKTGLIVHVSRFDFSPRTQSYMNKLSNSTIKIS